MSFYTQKATNIGKSRFDAYIMRESPGVVIIVIRTVSMYTFRNHTLLIPQPQILINVYKAFLIITLDQYLNEMTQGSISDEDKSKIIMVVMNAKTKQDVHNQLQKAFGNDKAKEYYSILKPII